MRSAPSLPAYPVLDRRTVKRLGSWDNNPCTAPCHSCARSPFGNVVLVLFFAKEVAHRVLHHVDISFLVLSCLLPLLALRPTSEAYSIALSGCKQKRLIIVLSHGTHAGSTRPSPSPPKLVPSFQPIVRMVCALTSVTNAASQPTEWRRWSPRTSSKTKRAPVPLLPQFPTFCILGSRAIWGLCTISLRSERDLFVYCPSYC